MGGLLNNLMGSSAQPQAAAGMSSLIPAAQSVPSATPDDHNGRVDYTGPQPFEYSSAQTIPGYKPSVLPTPEGGQYALPRQFSSGLQRTGLHNVSSPGEARESNSEGGLKKPVQLMEPEEQDKAKQDALPDFSNIPLAQLKQIYAALAS